MKANIGTLGEELACRYLESRGFKVIERNYRKVWGEIDIIGTKGNTTHFFEVKTVSREAFGPEENLHPEKLRKVNRAVQSYLNSREGEGVHEWQIDGILVVLNMETKQAKIELLENIGF